MSTLALNSRLETTGTLDPEPWHPMEIRNIVVSGFGLELYSMWCKMRLTFGRRSRPLWRLL